MSAATETKRVEQAREELNRLHAERDTAVVAARSLRTAFGIRSKDFTEQWNKVEQLTDAISLAEDRLRTAVLDEGVAA